MTLVFAATLVLCCRQANSMEGTTEPDGESWSRMDFDANISQQDLVDSYMVPFQACVEKGNVAGLMCSYNSVNGVPSCLNDWLLSDVARSDWQFDGYITSDCDADQSAHDAHHYRNLTDEETVRAALRAGTDVDCGSYVQQHAAAALNNSVITVADIDARLRNLFRVRMRLGHFDPKGPLDEITRSEAVCSDYAQALALSGTQQSAALLKNANGTLPLDRLTVGNVAVIGPMQASSRESAGYYGPEHTCYYPKFPGVADAVASGGVVVSRTMGVSWCGATDTGKIPQAVAASKAADTVILAVGTSIKTPSNGPYIQEGSDALTIALPGAQPQLIAEVAAAAKKPVVVVILTATPLDISELLANPKIGAVLHLGVPSTTVAGIDALLYGAISPAGRTVQTWYPVAYADQVSIFDFNMRPGPSAFARPDCTTPKGAGCPRGTNPGRTHRFYVDTPVIPFGFGLSYTRFAYAVQATSRAISLDAVRELLRATREARRAFPTIADAAAHPLVGYTINVTNTGTVDADDSVLGFLVPPGAGVGGVPLQTLFGFERVHVRAGETVDVTLYPTLLDFTFTTTDGTRQALTGTWGVKFGVAETRPHGQGYAETTLAAR